MRLTFVSKLRLAAAVGLVSLGVMTSSASAQWYCQPKCPQPACPPAMLPGTPSTSTTPSTSPDPSAASTSPSTVDTSLPSDSSLALGGGNVALGDAGYVDSAIPQSRFRVRYDSAYRNNVPDRAEFFYAKCGCFANQAAGAQFDPKAAGPPLAERRVDFQDLEGYLEYAVNNRFSGFIEVPYRWLNPENNRNTDGFSDLKAGFKYAFVADPCQYLTFQFRGYFPTGDSHDGLGTDHVSLEPSVLCYHRLTDCLSLDGEFRVWIPVGGSDFEGTVLRYGVALSYLVYNSDCYRVSPVGEMVGWSVLNGKEFDGTSGQLKSAGGDFILNAKVGVRVGFGDLLPSGFSRSDLYVGYGRALTGEVWYKDMLRVEYRYNF